MPYLNDPRDLSGTQEWREDADWTGQGGLGGPKWYEGLVEPDEWDAEPYAEIPVSAPPDDAERDEDDREGETKVLLRQASTIQKRGVKWLWRGRIPMGMLTLLAGRESIGKSTVSLDIAAQLTTGKLPGRYFGKPQQVIVCATEDSWSYTIRPRLEAVGADLDLVFHISVQDEDGHVRPIRAPGDTRRIEVAFQKIRPALLIIDPLMSVIDGKIDTHKQAEVQQALEPLVGMCDRLGMSILALIHVNKSNSADPLTNIMGSKAFATLPRSVLYCIEEEADFLLCHVKCNVGPKQASIHYRLVSVKFDLPADEVEEGDDPYIESSKVVWGAVDARTAADVLQAAIETTRMGGPAIEILGLIDSSDSPLSTGEIEKALPHLSKKQIENALARMVKADKIERITRGVYGSLKAR